ncbi:MAG: decaprenyl-phosphate phosphoribosyltransferase [Dehalococcoidia bacterium]|nr:MAG: decaprenyl-phosphate phosphoribosyltransferase [Dehalococcoidia bacterium]
MSVQAASTSPITPLGFARDFVVACRPMQWQKNLLVFAAFIFSARAAWVLDDPDSWGPLLLTAFGAFWLFNAIASGEYLLNDALDIERDRLHPRKRFRPIASGRVPLPAAYVGGFVLVVAGVAGAFSVDAHFGVIAAGYAALTAAYSLWLKRLVIVDVVVIASGFALRAVAGAAAIDVPISPWLFVCTTLGALFISVAKRRQELVLLTDNAAAHRGVLSEYTLDVLDQMSSVSASATIVTYALYVVSAENLPANHSMLLTLPFVLYGVFRYRLIAEQQPEKNADELISRDVPLLLSVLLFGLSALAVLAVDR